MTCRIFLDQNLTLSIAVALRRSGHDALAAQEANLLGASDNTLLRIAVGQRRVFLTADYRDFVRLSLEWNEQGRDFPGIVLVTPTGARYMAGEIVARVEQHITADAARLQNSLTWLPALQ